MTTPSGRTGRAPTVSWSTYRASIGDRSLLFSALVETWTTLQRALYPGSYVDLAPSTAISEVTYVDTDGRAAKFFADRALTQSELLGRTRPGAGTRIRFLRADYANALPLPSHGFDLLISLYAGPVWDHCKNFLQPGGLFLANSSHGDASLAALDPALTLLAAVILRSDQYRLDHDRLDRYLVPKDPAANEPETIRKTGRGVAYTRPAFAYVFRYDPRSDSPD